MVDLRSRLRELGVTPSKVRGQNFLLCSQAVHQILEFARPDSGVPLVEIGPGMGALTEHLQHFGRLKVFEVEEAFCQELRERYPAVEVIEGDIRGVDPEEIPQGAQVFGNLPYSLSTEILLLLIRLAPRISRAVLMLQREFIERLGADPGSKRYGSLSVLGQRSGSVRLGPVIPGTAFHPETKVDSQLVEICFFKRENLDLVRELWIERVTRAAFAERRRTVLNSISKVGLCEKARLEEVLLAMGIDLNTRAEQLSIEQFEQLADSLTPHCSG